jgi:hypothetical protein
MQNGEQVVNDVVKQVSCWFIKLSQWSIFIFVMTKLKKGRNGIQEFVFLIKVMT